MTVSKNILVLWDMIPFRLVRR